MPKTNDKEFNIEQYRLTEQMRKMIPNQTEEELIKDIWDEIDNAEAPNEPEDEIIWE